MDAGQGGQSRASIQEQAAALASQVAAELATAMADVIYAFQLDPEPAFEYISPSVLALTGYSDEEHYADPGLAMTATDERDRVLLSGALSTEPGTVSDVTVRFRRKDGRIIRTRHRTRSAVRPDGSAVIYAAVRDVTAQSEAEEALAASQEMYRLLAENASDVVFRTDTQAVLEWVSPSVTVVLGWDAADMIGHRITAFTHEDDLEQVRTAGDAANEGDRVSFEARYLCRDGGYRWLEVTARPLTDTRGRVVGKVGSCRDVHSEIEAYRAIERSEERFRLAMESAPTGMAVIDLDRRFVEVNPALCLMLGRDTTQLLATQIADIIHPTDDQIDLRLRGEVLRGRMSSATHEMRLVRSDSATVWVQHSVGLLRDEDGAPMSYVSQFVNVTDAREAREALHFMATHDPMTQLLNRRELIARMGAVLAHAPRAGSSLGVLYADLDGLKAVNDTFGHSVGDRVIIEAARRVGDQVRDDDLAARIGGDEFVIALLAVSSLEDVLRVARKIAAAMDAPLVVDGHVLPLSISIGVALAQPGDDADAVMNRADAALYRAKKSGGKRIEA